MKITKHLVRNMNRYVRTLSPTDIKHYLTLDGHSSRNGFAWLEFCKNVGCEFVQLPLDTSHLLEASDRKVNHQLKRDVKDYQDKLCSLGRLNWSSLRIKLVLSIVGYNNIENGNIHQSFRQCGLSLMDYKFTSFELDSRPDRITFVQPSVSMPDDGAVKQLVNKLWSKENSATILKEAASLLSRM